MASTGFLVACLLFLSSQLQTPASAITKVVHDGGTRILNVSELDYFDVCIEL